MTTQPLRYAALPALAASLAGCGAQEAPGSAGLPTASIEASSGAPGPAGQALVATGTSEAPPTVPLMSEADRGARAAWLRVAKATSRDAMLSRVRDVPMATDLGRQIRSALGLPAYTEATS